MTGRIVAALLACLALAGFTVVVTGPAFGQSPSACSDGVDNDADGLTDHPSDPGCGSPNSDSEVNEPNEASACSDGVDNDNDGRVRSEERRVGKECRSRW